jgi:CubicO group peptidase (beta-lactamase class C family)
MRIVLPPRRSLASLTRRRARRVRRCDELEARPGQQNGLDMKLDTASPSPRADPGLRRRSWWLAAAILTIVIGATAVWWTTGGEVDEVETIRPAAAVTAVEIDLAAGTVSLGVGDQLTLEVERRTGRFAGTPTVTSAVDDGVLQVAATCPTLGIGHCTTDVTITLPPAVAIDVATGAGSIDGIVTNGPVRVTTAAGRIALTITQDVDELSVATGAGSIDLIVPDVPYDVTAHTSVGRTSVEVGTAADAPRTIEARSEVGSITIGTDASAVDTASTSMRADEPTAVPAAERTEMSGSSSQLDAPGALEAFLDETMADHLERFELAGAAVTVVNDGEIVVSKGYGYADVSAQTPVEADTTVFPTASVAKLFTWTAIMQLVEQGQLDLDAEVNSYLNGFEIPDEFEEPIRVWHLLSHTAGFEDKPMSLAVRPEDLTDLETSLIRDMPSQDWEPGRYTAYNNYGAGLAGHLVAEVSGMSWEDYLDRNILDPLHMTRTSGTQPTPDALPEGMTKVYNSHGGDLVEAEYDLVALAPFGGMVATSRDMANFMIAHLQDGRVGETRILQETTAQQMHRQLFTQDPRLNGNAHGFWESTEHGQHVLSHPGDHNTSMTGLWLLPDHDLGLYVAYNSDRGGEARTALWDAFLDHTFPTDPTTPPDPTPGAQEDLERFEGNYATSRVSSTTPGKLLLLATMTVSAQDGDLVTSVAGYEPTRWIATGHDAFVSADGRSRMILSGDAGQPQRLYFDGPSTSAYAPLTVWVASAWYDHPSLHGGLLAGSLLLILSILVLWPAAAMVRRRRGTDRPAGGTSARWWAAATGGLYLLFVILLVASLLDFLALEFGASPVLVTALSVGIAAAVLTLGAVAHSVLAWRNGYWSVAGRIHYTLVTVAFVTLAWQLNHWNLLGFHV